MKKIVIINAHPNPDSFCFGLANAYKMGAKSVGAEVKEISIRDLDFNPNLAGGFQHRTELEPDLLTAWEKIQWADHLVWVHPVWWGGLPAIAKGFIDRLFLPGFVFKYRENSVWWDKLLTGKTGHILTTLDQPGWYYHLFYGRPSVNQLKKSVLGYCGVTPVQVDYFGAIRNSSTEQRAKWLAKAESLGKKNKS